MRDIEFRAKIKGDAGIYKVWGINWLDQKMLIQRACGDEWVSLDKIQNLMQFTGLVDKKGIRIYEGDIISYEGQYGSEIGQVCWYKFGAWGIHGTEFYLHDIFFDQVLRYDAGTGMPIYTEVEIIGNIYENEELLK